MVIGIQSGVNLSVLPGEVSGHLFHRGVCPSVASRRMSTYITYPGNLCAPSHLLSVCYFVTPKEVSPSIALKEVSVNQLHLMDCMNFLTSDEVSVTFQNVCYTQGFFSVIPHVV